MKRSSDNFEKFTTCNLLVVSLKRQKRQVDRMKSDDALNCQKSGRAAAGRPAGSVPRFPLYAQIQTILAIAQLYPE